MTTTTKTRTATIDALMKLIRSVRAPYELHADLVLAEAFIDAMAAHAIAVAHSPETTNPPSDKHERPTPNPT